jgi:hypothetical protein
MNNISGMSGVEAVQQLIDVSEQIERARHALESAESALWPLQETRNALVRRIADLGGANAVLGLAGRPCPGAPPRPPKKSRLSDGHGPLFEAWERSYHTPAASSVRSEDSSEGSE